MIYFYGGAFDPITKAHVSIIKQIVKQCRNTDKVVVAISDTDEKNYHADFDSRYTAVSLTLRSQFNGNCPLIVRQNSRTYNFIKRNYANDEVTIVVGEDEWDAINSGKWVNGSKLLADYSFLVVFRYGTTKNIEFNNQCKALRFIPSSNDTVGVSSSTVREIFYRNPMCHYNDVKQHICKKTFEVIKENEQYKQNSANYAKDEAEYLKQYAIMKKEHGWGDPSVTADIVAHNGDKVLLIRRGNYPYKNYWALPGGFFNAVDSAEGTADLDIDYAAAREFEEETTIKIDHSKFHQIKTYAHMFDPRCRIVDVAFEVRVNAKDMKKAAGADDALEARWFDLNDLPTMAFHHEQIINDFKQNNYV